MKKLVVCFIVLAFMFTSVPAFAFYNESIEMDSGLKIVVADTDTFVLKPDGTLWYMGEDATKFIKIRSGVKDIFSDVSLGGSKSAGIIKNDNTLWKLGYIDGEADEKLLVDVVYAAPGFDNWMALKSDGSVWAWGDNIYYQLGNGTQERSDVPIKVIENAASIYENDGWYLTAIDKNGDLYAWGWVDLIGKGYCISEPRKYASNVAKVINRGFLLNDGTFIFYGEKFLDNVKYVSPGYDTVGLIKEDNSLWMFGTNDRGQLGDGKPLERDGRVETPVKIMNDVKCVTTGYMHTAIVKNDGSLWTVGANFDGQLGTGKLQVCNQYTGELNYDYDGIPKKVMENVNYAVAGNHTIALKNDGTLWLLGNGHASPIKVMDNLNYISILIAGNVLKTDQPPVLINNRAFVPMRAIMEELGLEVSWDAKTKTVTGTNDTISISLTIGQKYAVVNGETVPLDAPAQSVNNRTLVPARFLAESLGYTVNWDPVEKVIRIDKE